MQNGLLPGSNAVIEGYGLSSTLYGVIVIVYEVVNLIAVFPVGILCPGSFSLLNWVAVGAALNAVGMALFASPYLILEDTAKTQWVLVPFVLGQSLIGLGSCFLYTLMPLYILHKATPATSSFNISIFLSGAIMGAAAGFVLSGMTAKEWGIPYLLLAAMQGIYVIVWSVVQRVRSTIARTSSSNAVEQPNTASKTTSITEGTECGSDTRSVKSVNSTLTTSVSDVLASTPSTANLTAAVSKDISGSAALVEDGVMKTDRKTDDMNDEEDKTRLKSTPSQRVVQFSKRVVRNPYICLLLATIVLRAFVISGLISFMSKWIDERFTQLSADEANYVVGGVAVPGSLVGLLVSGVCVYKYKLSLRSMGLLGCGASLMMITIVPLFIMPWLATFILILFSVQALFFISDAFLPILLLKSIEHPELEGLMMSLQLFLARLLGSIPGPVFLGWIFDIHCIERSQGTCLVYDNRALGLSMVGSLWAFLVTSFATFSAAVGVYNKKLTTTKTTTST